VGVRARRPPTPRRAVLGLEGGGRHLFAPDRLGRLDQIQRVPVLGFDDEPPERIAETLGQLPDGALGLRRRQRLQVIGRHGPPHQQDRGADAERARLVEHQADWQEHRGRTFGRLPGLAQQEACGARAKRHQGRLALALAFGKNQERLALLEHAPGRAEHGPIVHGAALVLSPVYGDGAGQARQLADDRITEERGFGDGSEPSRQRGGQKDTVHQALLVIGRDDQRPGEGHPLEPDHVDAPVEEPDEKPRQRSPETGRDRLSSPAGVGHNSVSPGSVTQCRHAARPAPRQRAT
jgi:hypothetical protein